jgi:hypothetical protein
MVRHVAAALFAVCSVAVCAGVAFAAVRAGDHLLGETIPASCGKRGLVVGLMGIWGTVLFGFLLGQVDWITDKIAGGEAPAPPAAPKPE